MSASGMSGASAMPIASTALRDCSSRTATLKGACRLRSAAASCSPRPVVREVHACWRLNHQIIWSRRKKFNTQSVQRFIHSAKVAAPIQYECLPGAE